MNERFYIIKDDEELLNNLFNEIKNGINFLYSNCICHIKIGNKIFKTNDLRTVLYNEDNKICIILPEKGKITKKDLLKLLEEKHIQYYEIQFNEQPKRPNDIELPELYLCHNEDNLENRLDYAINQGNINCEYYPKLYSSLELGYKGSSGSMKQMYKIKTDSLVQIDNIILLISNQYDNKEIRSKLEEQGINYTIMDKNNKKGIKKRTKKFI